jgi:hypothetical protein
MQTRRLTPRSATDTFSTMAPSALRRFADSVGSISATPITSTLARRTTIERAITSGILRSAGRTVKETSARPVCGALATLPLTRCSDLGMIDATAEKCHQADGAGNTCQF